MVNSSINQNFAAIVFSLLLDKTKPIDLYGFDEATWSGFEKFCKKNIVLVRIGNSLSERGFILPTFFSEAVVFEQQRIARIIQAMERIYEFCSNSGIECVFPKAFMHYPDMGHDIDLWIADIHCRKIDLQFENQLKLKKDCNSLLNLVAGKRAYIISEGKEEISLEIHHGRTGIIGEFPSLVTEAIKHHYLRELEGLKFPVPRDNEVIVIQAVQRFLSHRSIRISDLLLTNEIIRSSSFNQEQAVSLAKKCGAYSSFIDYLIKCKEKINDIYKIPNYQNGKLDDEKTWKKSVIILPRSIVIRNLLHKSLADIRYGRLSTIIMYAMMPALYYVNKWLFLFNRRNYFKPESRHVKNRMRASIIIVFLIFGWMLLEPLYVCEKKVTIRNAKIPSAFNGKKIVFITDLHFNHNFNTPKLLSLLNKIKELHPDVLVYGGDYIYTIPFLEECFDELKRVKGRFGTFAVVGNHDYATSITLIKNAVKQSGITLLINRGEEITISGEKILIYGVDDLKLGHPNCSQSEDSSLFLVLVSHNPDYSLNLENKNIDLVLSGHTHGGQVSLFGLWAPLVPSKIGNRFRSGVKKIGNMSVIISNGIGTVFPNVRFFAPPDFYVITLEKMQN